METKVCRKCLINKSVDLFGLSKQNKDGLKSYCKECCRNEYRIYREKYPEKKKESVNRYYFNNKEKELYRFKLYRENNIEKRKETCRKYVENNRDKHNEYSKIWKREQRIKNPIYKLISNIRERTKDYLNYKRLTKNNTIMNVIGCSPQELKEHLERQFTEGMSWDNYGFYGWHIDHIIPLSSGKTEEDVYKLCHYTNLQPLWAKDNLSKGSKLTNL
jgi:hypothetical protein